ncbi:glycosyltransferase, partial [Candidatus Bathyarchaeota archaeon]|nr:glycosyltransferase [Candidatus Bathyarchaeota archaeon]
MDNVVMVAPNAGLEMAGGGGCRVAAKVAEAMNERGYGIELVALTGDTLEQIERLHGVRLGDTNLRYILGKGSTLPVPEPVALSMLSLYIRRLLSMIEPRLIVFQDDILLPAVKNYDGKILVYTHFPLLHKARARARFSEEWSVSIKQRIYDVINQRLLAYNSNPADVIIASSTFAANYCKTAWNRDDIEVFYPPVDNPFSHSMKPQTEKESLVICLGGIHPGKRHELAIKACKLSKLDYDLVV